MAWKLIRTIPVDFFNGLFTVSPTHLGCIQSSYDLQGCEVGVWGESGLEADCLHLLLLPGSGVWSRQRSGSPCGTASRCSPLQRVVVYPLHSLSWDRWNVAQLMVHAEYNSLVPPISNRKAHWTLWSETLYIYEPAYRFRKHWCWGVRCSLPLLLAFQLGVQGILLLSGSSPWITQHPGTGRQQVQNAQKEATFGHVTRLNVRICC